MRCRVLSTALALPLMVLPLTAQADDRDYLTALLEDSLSDAGREVTVTGFAGALSSQASIASLTIADDQGIWLTLNGVVLDWSRSALLAGRIEVSELSAREIIFARLPVTDQTALPSPEASVFSLPDLPVSVAVGRLAADRIVLGDPILGEEVEGRLDASLSLAGGEGQARVSLERTDDGPETRLSLTAGFVNQTRNLTLDLQASEGAGGIAARLLNLPGAPSTELTLNGSAPIDDFRATLRLATDGQDRLTGSATLRKAEAGGTEFSAAIRGDIAPLFLPEYAAFFGPEVRLDAKGRRGAEGDLDLQAFVLKARAIDLTGQIDMAADGLPQRFEIRGRLGLPDATPILLPLSGENPTRMIGADLALAYDAATDAGWRGSVVIDGLDRADFDATRLAMTGSGQISRLATGASFEATLEFAATGLVPANPALAQALGSEVTGGATLWAKEGVDGLHIPQLDLAGADYGLGLSGLIEGLDTGLRLRGRVAGQMQDLSRLSALVGRPLGGAANMALDGGYSVLGGSFDLQGRIDGRDLRLGQPQADALLAGESHLTLDVTRDQTGTTLRDLSVAAGPLVAQASGQLASAGSDLTATVDLSDLSRLGGGLRGGIAGQARITGTPDDATVTLDAQARALGIGQPQTDRLLQGDTALSVVLKLAQGTLGIESAQLNNPQFSLTATGTVSQSARRLQLQARLANLALLAPQFPGPVTLTGSAAEVGQGFDLDLTAQGPGRIDARIGGRMAADGTADLTIRGSAEAALANPFLNGRLVSGPLRFDLTMKGPAALQSLAGEVRLSGGRIADPTLAFAFEGVDGTARLGGAVARVDAAGRVNTGGRVAVQGSIGMAAPFVADLTVDLTRAVIRDPQLFQTIANGRITVQGPVTGGAEIAGRINLDETEVQIPSTGLGGLADLPDLRHVSEPAEVRATRARAGLLGLESAAGRRASRPYALNLSITAPNRLFIRGRGLDAELGGALVLRGTTAAVSPSGSFALIRGRLDILGRRLNLTEATLVMEGDFVPVLGIGATTESDGIATSVRITGAANDPQVSFTSNPELPEEEVLARLLFGRGIENLSALQAVQLANAVATLAGRGGVGIVGRIRQGFGLDDLDVQTDAQGGTTVTVGKYLSENLYTEVTVGAEGQSQINLNLDLTDSITLRGKAEADGQTGIGVFFEKDY